MKRLELFPIKERKELMEAIKNKSVLAKYDDKSLIEKKILAVKLMILKYLPKYSKEQDFAYFYLNCPLCHEFIHEMDRENFYSCFHCPWNDFADYSERYKCEQWVEISHIKTIRHLRKYPDLVKKRIKILYKWLEYYLNKEEESHAKL